MELQYLNCPLESQGVTTIGRRGYGDNREEKLHRLYSNHVRGMFAIGRARHLLLILNVGSIFSWVPPESSGCVIGYASKFYAGTTGLAITASTKGQGENTIKQIISSDAQFIGLRARFDAAWASCINSLLRNNFKRRQNPERGAFIFTHLKMYSFGAAGLAVTANLFKLRRIYQ